MRGDEHDAASLAQVPQASAKRCRRCIVQASERLVEQHQPGLVQQRALEREPLPHAARESDHRIVAVREPGTLERGGHA